jgi:putative ABC transport system permease protein
MLGVCRVSALFLIAIRDLQFRLRRFVISVVAVALVLALTVVLAGVASSLDVEMNRTLDQLGVDHWMVNAEASGPFFGAVPMDEASVAQVRAVDGVTEAEPQVFYPYTLDSPSGPKSITLLGVEPGKLGAPRPDEGRGLENPGEALAQPMYGLRLGSTARVGGKSFTIVGTLHDSTMLGGIPNMFVSTSDLQSIAFKGAPVITAVAIKGSPTHPVSGLKTVSRADARADLIRPLSSVKQTISLLSVLLWIVTGCIIGSVIYLSALERTRDFAVFKAIGVSNSWVLAGLVLQAVLLSALASVAAIFIARLLAPVMSVPVAFPAGILVLVPATAVIVSVVGSLAGVRRAVRVDPALAFG